MFKKNREIAYLAVLNFFPVQKLILAIFEIAKNGICSKKIFREIDLFDFTSFFGLDFLRFSGLLWPEQPESDFKLFSSS